MEHKEMRWCGMALILSSVLMVLTMALHPAGGSFSHLLKTSKMIMGVHALAMISIPVNLFGFRGLAKHFGRERPLSNLAFSFMAFGSVAALCAAALNGLALPLFIGRYADATPEVIQSVSPILRYSFTLNHAFDLIFIVGSCIAIVLWSAAVVKGRELPRWLGYYGLVLGGLGIAVLFSGFTLVDLYGFRLFILGLVSWIVSAGIVLRSR